MTLVQAKVIYTPPLFYAAKGLWYIKLKFHCTQVCCCVCLFCKAAILLNSTIKSQTQESLQQMLFESNRLISQILKCSTLPSPMLKLLSDSLEYFRINLQNESSKKSREKLPTLSLKTLPGTVQVLQSYISVFSSQCKRLNSELL